MAYKQMQYIPFLQPRLVRQKVSDSIPTSLMKSNWMSGQGRFFHASQGPPNFQCIAHQKTTAGTIRGGSKIFYNSTAIINIEIDHDRGRFAVMQKSRYGTVGFMYNIGDDEVFRAGDW